MANLVNFNYLQQVDDIGRVTEKVYRICEHFRFLNT